MKILRASERNFRYEFEKILKRSASLANDAASDVFKIVDDVALSGDKALINYTEKWDKHTLKEGKIAVTRAEIKKAMSEVSKETINDLKAAAKNIENFYSKQPIPNFEFEEKGLKLGLRYTPIDKIGIYVPGGKAFYPSSVLMNAIPAKVAGVKKVFMATPFFEGKVHPAVLAAAEIAKVDKIYKVGGAHAVAAFTYGTSSVEAVDKIVGPGNIYVTLAKKIVYGQVGIDMIAGPTEVCIIADQDANPKIVAADLLSQAEHDEHATCVLITFNINFAHKVDGEVRRQLRKAARREIAQKAIKERTFIIIAKDSKQAVKLSNEIAPEHLELMLKDAEKVVELVTHAGAIFLGYDSPVAMGDYFAGPSHVLPTAGTARFSSVLNILDFMKASSVTHYDNKALKKHADQVIKLAEMETLEAHAESVRLRLSAT